jgi:hypothetical protein
MRTIARRLQKLEVRFAVGPETEATLRLRALIKEGRQRVADARARGILSPPDATDWDREDITGLTPNDILNRGRTRARASHLASLEAAAADYR